MSGKCAALYSRLAMAWRATMSRREASSRDPFVKAVGVELFDILSDLGESKISAILIGRMAIISTRGCRVI